MAVILDGSIVVAAADTADLNHEAAIGWFERVDEPLLVTAFTLTELDHLLQRELGVAATLAVIDAVVGGAVRLVPTTAADLARAAVLLAAEAEHRPRLTEAVLVATAERLGIRRIGTFDRRPIAVFRPRHVRAFDLEP
ncbi:MAG: type II toxin-antitoxin system VapC family toxin [Candidatus Limnocylindrales bacterium]